MKKLLFSFCLLAYLCMPSFAQTFDDAFLQPLQDMRNNRIHANKIHHYGKHMYDVSAIYALSAQPGSVISNNYVDSIYVAPYANNHSPVGKDKQANKHAAISKPVVIEVVAPAKANEAAIKNVFTKNGISTNDIYHWNNHLAAFTSASDTINIRKQIAAALPQSRVNIYNDMFYVFDRNACNGKGEVNEWDHILLTANLVKDPKLQQEYLDYHARQQQLFPEVAKGFCNADFQQLLLFKNGRQLMLIISIPKGASLDVLNPKTTENNPRVNEWNSLMSKYQEGIEGTKKGETWVFLERLKM